MRRFTAATVCLLLVYAVSGSASSEWESALHERTVELAAGLEQPTKLYIGTPIDTSRERRYYPFLDSVRHSLEVDMVSHGFHVVKNPGSADAHLRIEFLVESDALSLDLHLVAPVTGQLLKTSRARIASTNLPKNWTHRDLKDVAFELTGQLEELMFGQKVRLIIGEISSETGLVSEFSDRLAGHIREELGRLNMFEIKSPASTGSNLYELGGNFLMSNQEVLIRLSLTHLDSREEKATVSSRLAINSIPQGVSLFPENKITAEQSVDVPIGQRDDERPMIQIAAWVNHENHIYQSGDNLVVYLRPAQDLYMRVYYIQSDGTICQLMPFGRNQTGYARKDRIRSIGDHNSEVELIIDDSTTGQETIKVFASRGPIEDEDMPRRYETGSALSCIVGGYEVLVDQLTRALKANYRIRPVAEVKIRVVKQSG